MIKLSQSEYANIVKIEVSDKITGKDAEKSESFIKAHYSGHQNINAFVDIKNIEGTNLSGIVKGLLLDIRHWGQFNKFAVTADKSWIANSAKTINLAPGIHVKHFNPGQTDQAFEWLSE